MRKEWGVVHTFAPVGHPTSNAVAERLIRTMKEECIWVRDWRSTAELRTALEPCMRHYNAIRPHQLLDWQPPTERHTEQIGEAAAAA